MVTRYRTTTDLQHDPPSFSSTLLDSIYRSFDDNPSPSPSPSTRHRHDSLLFREIMAVKTKGDARSSTDNIVDSWMAKMDTTNDVTFPDRRRSLCPPGHRHNSPSHHHRSRGFGKVTTSSDSSSFGGFSSSDTDSFYSANNKSKSLKPIRTSFSESFADELLYSKNRRSHDKPAKGEGSGARRTAKARAMKFYGDLKRMKQPISPGGKLANFLNSLFNATSNAKKQRISTSAGTGDTERWERPELSKLNHTTASTPSCSTASSYSRSCLSKTPSSAAAKRSVRFSPVNVVIDENFTASTRKSTNRNSVTAEGSACGVEQEQELKLRAMENNRRVEEAAMDILKKYKKKWGNGGEEEEEEEDGESCCSSDLFELENLLQIGVERYCGELPVYETTRLDTNRAISSRFIV